MAHLFHHRVITGVYLLCCFYRLVYFTNINVPGVVAKVIAKPVAQLRGDTMFLQFIADNGILLFQQIFADVPQEVKMTDIIWYAGKNL